MFRISLLLTIILCVLFVGSISAQAVDQKTQDLVAALDKTKYKKKEKKNISIELYIDVKNTAALRSSPAEYSGSYNADGYHLDLQVASNGAATGSGYDSLSMGNGNTVKFTLQDARVQGALLTATKVYQNGETRPFEAAFVNRTVTSGSNPSAIASRETAFGLGWVDGPYSSADGQQSWSNRVFLERK